MYQEVARRHRRQLAFKAVRVGDAHDADLVRVDGQAERRRASVRRATVEQERGDSGRRRRRSQHTVSSPRHTSRPFGTCHPCQVVLVLCYNKKKSGLHKTTPYLSSAIAKACTITMGSGTSPHVLRFTGFGHSPQARAPPLGVCLFLRPHQRAAGTAYVRPFMSESQERGLWHHSKSQVLQGRISPGDGYSHDSEQAAR